MSSNIIYATTSAVSNRLVRTVPSYERNHNSKLEQRVTKKIYVSKIKELVKRGRIFTTKKSVVVIPLLFGMPFKVTKL
jgi:hypothetical protein